MTAQFVLFNDICNPGGSWVLLNNGAVLYYLILFVTFPGTFELL